MNTKNHVSYVSQHETVHVPQIKLIAEANTKTTVEMEFQFVSNETGKIVEVGLTVSLVHL